MLSLNSCQSILSSCRRFALDISELLSRTISPQSNQQAMPTTPAFANRVCGDTQPRPERQDECSQSGSSERLHLWPHRKFN